MIRLALLGFWHVHAKDYLADAARHPDTEVVAAWDDDPDRGVAEAERCGLPFEPDLATLLARSDLDGVIVTTATSRHLEVMTAAARAGKHIFTEKVIAATLADTHAITSAAAEAGVAFTVSLPRLYHGLARTVAAAVDEGLLGRLTLMRARLAHDGALAGEGHPDGWLPLRFYHLDEAQGGAMIDLGCHPMYLTRHLLGMPDRVSASYGHVSGRAVEDNAVVTLRYPGGAVGIVETGFVSVRAPMTLELQGTAGALLYGSPDQELRLHTAEGWRALPLLPDATDPFGLWVEQIHDPAAREGDAARLNRELATDLSALMEAANRSARTGESVALASLVAGSA
jgi:predicted dehydrogenase